MDDVNSSDFELVEPDREQLERAHQRYIYDLLPSSAGAAAAAAEDPPHHTLCPDQLDRYLYPVNMAVRDYQRNMIRKALTRNIMVALPTGLGKTFIASVVMWNWFRWCATAKVLFLAPTRPLVTQQVENFLAITGVSVHDTAIFIQQVVKKKERELLWKSRRVFFATPQTVENDIRAGLVDVRDIVCVVIDEAHRATGNYAYVNLVREINQHNPFFRVLALTATPSGYFEGVQAVVENLRISSTEIRTEESLDVREYTHTKHLVRVVLDPSPVMRTLLKLVSELLEPHLGIFLQRRIVATLDPAQIHPFSFQEGIKRYLQSPATRSEYWVRAKGNVVYSVLYATSMLLTDGIYQFYQRLESLREQFLVSKPGSNLAKICGAPQFNALIQSSRELIYLEDGKTRNPQFLGHPKLERMVGILETFYRCNGADSRCIIFTNYRETAQEILWALEQQQPFLVASLFVGQQSSAKGVKGMTQKQQQALLDEFRKGTLNVLIATSVAEEGLDIAQVDLIICYDQSSSPIRSIQRMGRTGRARDGNVYILMTEKESKKLEHALNGHKWVEKRINQNADSTLKLKYCDSKRILPPITQKYVEVVVEPPKENTAAIESGDLLLAMRPTERDGYTAKRKRKAPARAGPDPKQTRIRAGPAQKRDAGPDPNQARIQLASEFEVAPGAATGTTGTTGAPPAERLPPPEIIFSDSE